MLFERSGVMDDKPTPKPPGSTTAKEENIAIDEIAHYNDGETIQIDSSDTRTYCVKNGAVQRVVVLPGCNGLGTLLLGKIDSKLEGGYWHPKSATLYAQRLGINLEFKAVGETVVQKRIESGLPKDPIRLTRVIAGLLVNHSRQTAETELVIKHQYERAEKEAGSARSANSLLEATRQELEEAQKTPTVTPDNIRLMCEIGQLKQNLQTAQTREQRLRDELRKLRSQIKAQETLLQLSAEDVREIKDLRKLLSDQTRWIERNCPDLPAVRAIQGLANGLSDEELDEMFAKAFKPVAKPPPLPVTSVAPAGKTAKAIAADESFKPEAISETADGDCEVIGDDELWPAGATELIELGPVDDDPTVFVEEVSSSILRATLPFECEASDPQPPPVNIPAMPPPPVGLAPVGSEVIQVTKAQDVSALRRQSTAEADEDDWRDSYNGDDVWNPGFLPRKE